MMERLWTPWRMAYISGEMARDGCFLCDFPGMDESRDEENLIVARGVLAFVILNKFPYNSGHLVVAPFRHTGAYEDLTLDEHTEIAALTQRAVRALNAEYKPEGYNIGVNQGRAAGAGVPDHLHVHVVPRWNGDTNYMTTVGNAKVLPEDLARTFARLKPLL